MEEAAAELPGEARIELAYDLADVYEYRVDMSRDLQAGDSFRVLYERSVGPRSTVRIGKILAADFTLSGSTITAVRFDSRQVGGEYFDAEGKSMRAAFLRAPLSFRRISSNFGSRRHPVLGTVRKHKGTDYAASSGTPVRAIGDGVVVNAGWSGGYGNLLAIRHRNGYVTRYGHLRGFARGVRVGQRGLGDPFDRLQRMGRHRPGTIAPRAAAVGGPRRGGAAQPRRARLFFVGRQVRARRSRRIVRLRDVFASTRIRSVPRGRPRRDTRTPRRPARRTFTRLPFTVTFTRRSRSPRRSGSRYVIARRLVQRSFPKRVISSCESARISRSQKRMSTHCLRLNSRVWSANQRESGFVDCE
jgi:hypothetical protein